MLLKGFALNGDRVNFKLSDCPVYFTNNIIGLVGIKGSKLISASTIMRGDEETGVFEGDRVYLKGELIGYVVYAGGFKLQTLNDELKNLFDDPHIKVKEGNRKTANIVSNSEYRSELVFRYNKKNIYMSVFLFKNKDGMLAVAGKSLNGTLIDPEQIHFYTGLADDDGTKLFFDELYKGGILSLRNGMPCIVKSESEIIYL